MTTPEEERQKAREDYEYFKAHGVCVRCRQRDARPGMVCCAECAARSNQRCKTWRQKMRDSGICTICGKASALPGHATCRECMDKMNQRRIEERRVRREERKREKELEEL